MLELHTVQDGDTLTLRCSCPEGFRVRVRLCDIDAPERGEILWAESRQCLASYAAEPPLSIDWTLAQGHDYAGWNRATAYIWAAQTLLQCSQLIMGMAAIWAPRGPSQHHPHLLRCQASAQHHRVGIWRLSSHRLHFARLEPHEVDRIRAEEPAPNWPSPPPLSGAILHLP